MKYPGGNTSTMFCEQVGTVTSLFEQWNDCEQTVVLYALLKRVPYSNLKFLQLSIEYNIAQNYSSQTKLNILETNANNGAFLTKLISTYKNFKCNEVQLNKDSIIYESNSTSQLFLENSGKYDKKEDILNDVLTYLPLLKPGNDDAKSIYLSLIPIAVDDSTRQIVPTELVQQILSYLLIHPAITNDDRRSLSQWLRHLEDHISSSTYIPNKPPNYFILPSEKTTSSSSLNAAPWQAVAPPLVPKKQSQTKLKQQTQQKVSTEQPAWDLHKIQVTQDFCDEIQLKEFKKIIGKNVDFKNVVCSNQNNNTLMYDNNNDDHHISFSKNGTEILDYDCDDYNKSNTQIAFDPLTNINEFLTVPNYLENNTLKTRRSNSLTTAPSSQNACTSSSENLSNIAQKPRSFSLSMESPRSSITSSGSETRLDDFKPNYLKFTSHNVGMSNIGQWLKSLRLHKYVWLFSNISYEQMLDITEGYLENLGVTKGARHKLVLCLQKLNERFIMLSQFEKDILTGQLCLTNVMEELTNTVLTPMKPVDQFAKEDVAGQFLKVVDLVASIITNKLISSQQDEECVNAFMWILDRALHSEAFVAHTNMLKEHKFKVSKIKLQFVPKGHYPKTTNQNSGIPKPRWTSNTKSHKIVNSEKSLRKNSNPMVSFPVGLNQQISQYQQDSTKALYSHGSGSYNKSSSYPNFTSSSTSSNPKLIQQQHINNSNNYHRHSLNNLISLSSNTNSPQQSTTVISNSTSSILCKENIQVKQSPIIKNSKSSIVDINSRLEFLCLQMTEQAIN